MQMFNILVVENDLLQQQIAVDAIKKHLPLDWKDADEEVQKLTDTRHFASIGEMFLTIRIADSLEEYRHITSRCSFDVVLTNFLVDKEWDLMASGVFQELREKLRLSE